MRTRTVRPHRAVPLLAGAVAALVVGGAAAPAAYAGGPDEPAASQSAKKGHATSAAKAAARKSSDNRATSNKDGRSHNDKWQAQADPDGDENGGIDQPGGPGGVNTDDQDGNNGSGNDSDCEDDNRGKGIPGHCKVRPSRSAEPSKPDEPTRPHPSEAPTDSGTPGGEDDETDEVPEGVTGTPSGGSTTPDVAGDVRGIEAFASAAAAGRAPASAAPVAAAPTNVAPAADASGTLPNTGADAAVLAMLAGGLATAGAGTVLVRRARAAGS